MIKIILPTFVELPRKTKKDKKWIINLNNYRNTHYQTLNNVKVKFAEDIKNQLNQIPPIKKPVKAVYTIFVPSERRMDLSNIIPVVRKFAEDAIVSAGILPDDNYTVIVENIDKFGGVDAKNPRVELVLHWD